MQWWVLYLYAKSARHAEIISETKKDIVDEGKSDAIAVSVSDPAPKLLEEMLLRDRNFVAKPLPHIFASQKPFTAKC